MNPDHPHLVFAGGGTAGHLFPGLAVAERLARSANELTITFAGSGKPFERQHVAAAGFPYVALPCRPLPSRARDAFRFVADNVSGYYAARRIVRDQHVSLVVGLGGYASVPMARAATRRDIPCVLLEQNVVPGRATRWLAPSAALVCAAFEEVRAQLQPGCPLRVTGNPLRTQIRKSVLMARRPAMADRNREHSLLVLGGSGGAKTLNQQVPWALYKAGAALTGWRILHQSGDRDADATRDLYGRLGLPATVVPFIDDMQTALVEADLAISRSGGTTLAELAAFGVPAVLLPYPHAKDDHQRKNADVFAAAGACRIVDQRELAERLDNHLATLVAELAGDVALRSRMSEAMLRRAHPKAARLVAKAIENLVWPRQACGEMRAS